MSNHRIMGAWQVLVATVSVVLLTIAGAGAAQANEPVTNQVSDTVELVLLNNDGSWSPVEAPEPLNLHGPEGEPTGTGDEGAVTPYLINFSQWTSCFVLNNAGEVFGTYWWVQGGGAVTLQCGNNSYGYKHLIAQGHDTQWNTVFNNALAAGWTASVSSSTSWDDLMHMVLANQLGVGGSYYSENPISQKACTYSTYGLYNTSTGKVVYTFGSEAVWSMNNNRIITSYPSSRGYCNA